MLSSAKAAVGIRHSSIHRASRVLTICFFILSPSFFAEMCIRDSVYPDDDYVDAEVERQFNEQFGIATPESAAE